MVILPSPKSPTATRPPGTHAATTAPPRPRPEYIPGAWRTPAEPGYTIRAARPVDPRSSPPPPTWCFGRLHIPARPALHARPGPPTLVIDLHPGRCAGDILHDHVVAGRE